jgi:hypothetical protein
VGSSFTRYRGQGFWSRDAGIQLWLYILSEEAREVDEPPEWLRLAADEWHLQATLGIGGCVSAGLDSYAATPERAAVLLKLANQGMLRLRERGDTLPMGWLNSLGLGPPGACFTSDLPTELFTRVGEAFIKLLRGELAWDADTSPVL